jgi:hypothetical protein
MPGVFLFDVVRRTCAMVAHVQVAHVRSSKKPSLSSRADDRHEHDGDSAADCGLVTVSSWPARRCPWGGF